MEAVSRRLSARKPRQVFPADGGAPLEGVVEERDQQDRAQLCPTTPVGRTIPTACPDPVAYGWQVIVSISP